MSPIRPELMVFLSPDKKMEVHAPARENVVFIKKGFFFDDKFVWTSRIHVELMFSDPTSSRVFTVGGLGDSGMKLGEIVFYTFEGSFQTIQLKDFIPDIEKLSREFSDMSNFPWVSGIDINETQLKIWVCDKKLVTVKFPDLKVEVIDFETKPEWLIESSKKVVSPNAEKRQWLLKK